MGSFPAPARFHTILERLGPTLHWLSSQKVALPGVAHACPPAHLLHLSKTQVGFLGAWGACKVPVQIALLTGMASGTFDPLWTEKVAFHGHELHASRFETVANTARESTEC
jgi:hypothetical protein